jgi:4'-phosphopantetheinyl transferase
MPSPRPLEPDRAEVYFVRTGVADPVRQARLLELLTEEEHERAARFIFDHHRWIYIAAHALLQHQLTELTGVGGRRGLDTRKGAYGRPELLEPFGEPRLRFNLTHTEGLVAVAFCRGHDVGVDAEAVNRGSPIHELAGRFFSPEEAAFIADAPTPFDRARFFDVWTAKEAVVKALGVGLSLPLDSFSVRFDPLRLAFVDPGEAHAHHWTIDAHPLAGHRLTLAVRTDGPRKIRTSFSEISLDELAPYDSVGRRSGHMPRVASL